MALLISNPPDQTRQALAASLADFSGPADASISSGLIHAPGQQVFILELQDLVDGGAGIQGANPAGWRFLAGAADQALAAEVSEPPRLIEPLLRRPKMRSLSRGLQIGKAIQATHEAQTLPQVQAQNYLLSVLRIPGLLVEALWLKSQGGGDDLVVPYLTLNAELQTKRIFTMGEFLGLVRPLATELLKFDDDSPPRS